MTFPTQKRINTELFIDRTAPLFIGETQNRDTTNKVNQTKKHLLIGVVSISCPETLPRKIRSRNEFNGNVIKQNIYVKISSEATKENNLN